MDTISRAKCEIWKVSAREEKLEHRKFSKQVGSRGAVPLKMFKFRVPEIPFPAFSVGHFQYANMKESVVRLQGRHIFSFFIPL